MTTLKKLNTLTKQVEHILATIPDTRNNDIELQAALLMTFYPPLERPIYNWMDFVTTMRRLPTLDHIARARRKVIRKSKGLRYAPTDPAVARARGMNMELWKTYVQQPFQSEEPSNYPPEIAHTLAMTGKTGIDD